MEHAAVLKTDSQSRISLKGFVESGQSFVLTVRKNGTYVLAPAKPAVKVKVPAKEKWLHENKAASKSLDKGIKEAAEGKLTSRGSFAKYAR
ncbi:MAG: hypothetical protein JWO82_1761 [Akkermansiaceae bacterium]|nr:hypothetical protein [Akkermansiaceae bacterium]